GKNCVRTTSYYAFMLFKPHRSKVSVKTESEEGIRAGDAKGKQSDVLPDLSISASRQGGELITTLVNPRHDLDMQVDCAIQGVTPRQGRAEILPDSNLNAFNSFDNPDQVIIRAHPVAVERDRFRITLPAMSVATVSVQFG